MGAAGNGVMGSQGPSNAMGAGQQQWPGYPGQQGPGQWINGQWWPAQQQWMPNCPPGTWNWPSNQQQHHQYPPYYHHQQQQQHPYYQPNLYQHHQYGQPHQQPYHQQPINTIPRTRLTEESRRECQLRGACFYCRDVGHLMRHCPHLSGKGMPINQPSDAQPKMTLGPGSGQASGSAGSPLN